MRVRGVGGHMPGRLRHQRQRHASWMPLVSEPCHTGHRVGTPSALHWVGGSRGGGGFIHAQTVTTRVHMPSKGRRRGGGYNKSCCWRKQGSMDGLMPLFVKVEMIQRAWWTKGRATSTFARIQPIFVVKFKKKALQLPISGFVAIFGSLPHFFAQKSKQKKTCSPPILIGVLSFK